MDNSTLGWIILIFTLCLTTFGSFWCLTLLTSGFTFCIGLISLLYIKQGDAERFYKQCSGNPLTLETIPDGGLKLIVNKLQNPQKLPKTDRRVTGSELIDSSLQEILGYVIRDYIMPWYNLISLDDEFPEVTIKQTSQSLAINISNRIKDIDWIPYLTTRLVDDAASHLRLFKQARVKLDQHNKLIAEQNKDQQTSPKQSLHKRNKSEADVTKYVGNNERSVGNSKFYLPERNKNTLEDFFYELECQMENDVICRDLVCIDQNCEKEFLSELVELILYILLPDEDFLCKPLRFVLREIFANCILLPLFSTISNPDFINQTIIWLCARDYLPSDIFLLTLRLTDNCEELRYTKELLLKEIQLLRSRDSGGDSDILIKQQLSSLFYVSKIIESRVSKLEIFGGAELNNTSDYYTKLESIQHIKLPLDVILKNNVALSYFIDFVTSTGVQAYLFFYLNIEGWKVSVEQQLSDVHLNKLKSINENTSSVYENIRSTALSIYEQYLGNKAPQKLQIKPSLVQTLFFKIKNLNEPPSEQWFDDIQGSLFEKLQAQNDLLPSFHRSTSYLRLLEELDLIQQNVIEEDTISVNSLEGAEINLEEKSKCPSDTNVQRLTSQDSSSSLQNLNLKNGQESLYSSHNARFVNSDSFLSADNCQKIGKHVRSFSDITDFAGKNDTPFNNIEDTCSDANDRMNDNKKGNENGKEEANMRTGDYILSVEIIEAGIVCEKGKTFGVYAIHVTCQYSSGFVEEWHIYRRYSDFYDLHTKIKDKYPNLSKIPFPGKKTFHNMERSVLEKRMRMLGYYIQQLCQSNILQRHHGLGDLLMTFLEQGDYDRATSGGPISHTIDTIVNPLKSGMKTIKNMPEQLINTVDEVVEGLTKVFHTKNTRVPEASKVGASLDVDSDDNIPLRIMLLLMDEVFDLKSRNQWLRRRIVTLLRQIVRTMFGDIVNRRILDYVSYITSPKNVAHYLHSFKHSFWPNGIKAEKSSKRDEATCYRTRLAAKVALLSWLSDELKHIIGSETTRRGLLTVFELFQRPVLNRRLLYVLLEGILTSLFPEKNMSSIFQKLHSKSRFSRPAKYHHQESKR